MIADIIAEDAEGQKILLVVVKTRQMDAKLISHYIGWIRKECPSIPFGMLVQSDQIYVIEYGPDDVGTVKCRLDTAEMLRPYDPEIGSKRRMYGFYLSTLVEAWLRDLAYHWKTERPPGSDELAATGLLKRLGGGQPAARCLLEPTLYVETSFIVGISKGQDLEAAQLLSGGSVAIQLVVPGVCYMEAFSVWERERKQRQLFIESLSSHIREVSRDLASPRATPLVKLLEESRIESGHLLAEIRDRLDEALYQLSLDAEFIELNHDIVHDSLSSKYLEEPTDNLILCSILWHARHYPGGHKAFVSSNHNHFGQDEVCNLLDAVGVKYFRRTEAALGWLRAQTDS